MFSHLQIQPTTLSLCSLPSISFAKSSYETTVVFPHLQQSNNFHTSNKRQKQRRCHVIYTRILLVPSQMLLFLFAHNIISKIISLINCHVIWVLCFWTPTFPTLTIWVFHWCVDSLYKYDSSLNFFQYLRKYGNFCFLKFEFILEYFYWSTLNGEKMLTKLLKQLK